MRIIQLLRNLSYGDAIGNDVLAIDKALKSMGYNTEIYAEFIDSRLPSQTAYPVNRLVNVEPEDVIIYHFSTGTDLNYRFAEMNCRKIMRYHNVTPPEFFKGYNYEAEKSCEQALKCVREIADKIDYVLAVSDFNKSDLVKMGYKQKIDVMPILIPFSDYDKKPNRKTIKKYSDGRTNILFTGRVAPNKKHEDIIRAFYCYKKYIDKDARLFLVGGYSERDRYFRKLNMYVERLGVKDVIFTGHIKFDEILAYHKLSDLYVSMSEHEGFGVPLAEAMYFKEPILAYGCTAIPETLGDGGLITYDKDPMLCAKLMERIINDPKLRDQIVRKQNERLKDFAYETIYKQLMTYINSFVKG